MKTAGVLETQTSEKALSTVAPFAFRFGPSIAELAIPERHALGVYYSICIVVASSYTRNLRKYFG